MYLERTVYNETHFCIRPSVVKDGVKTTFCIYPSDSGFKLKDGETLELRILPKDYSKNYTFAHNSLFGRENQCEVYEVSSINGVITFDFEFYGFQEWIIYLKRRNDSNVEWYWVDSFPESRTRLSVYSIPEELYGYIPMKGDLHIHTTNSDGSQSPEYNVAAYREAGFDFLSLTDHYKYNDGYALRKFFSFANPMVILPGEEIHDGDSVIHMVSVGGERSISDIINNDPNRLAELLKDAKKKYQVPDGLFEHEYLMRAVIYDEIKRSGGYAILPHPMWQIPERFSVDTRMSSAVLNNGLTDAFEVFGGCAPEGNDLQLSLYYSMNNKKMPVIGSSDSHSVTTGITAFNELYTIVFVCNCDVLKSISEGKSVAVYHPNGQNPRMCGDFPYVKYAHFLLRCYFPRHNILCKDSGALLKKFVEGDVSLKGNICRAEDSVTSFMKGFFGL